MLSTEVPYDPESPLLDIYLRETETYVHRKTCIQMFTAALFIIAPKWKQTKYPSTDEWINKTEYDEILFHHKKE